MEEYTVRIQGDTLLALHGEQAIYRGKVIKEQGKMMFHLGNGIGKDFFSAALPKGFALLRNRRQRELSFQYEGKQGALHMMHTEYEWQCADIVYRIVCMRRQAQVQLLFYDRETLLGVVLDGRCTMRNSVYSAEIVATWMLVQCLIQDKDQPWCEPQLWMQLYQQGMAQWD